MVSVDLDDLYGLALDRFIPERASLVRGLRSGGEREQAAVVAAMRKPSVAAWAVNQLIRTQRREVDELFAAGDALRDAQAGVLAGRADARELRSATERERAAVEALVQIARGLLSSGGHELSAATIERVTETLHAAALDDEARGQVSEGRLVRELRHVGFGAGLGAAVTATPSQEGRESRARTPAAGGAEAERQAAKERKAAEATERRERDEARKQARAVQRDAAREVDRAERALRTAQERQARATEALRQADAAVGDAESSVDAAIAAHRQAKQQLDNV
jgi:hypothetical protein